LSFVSFALSFSFFSFPARCADTSNIILLIYNVVYIILFAAISWKLRQVSDGFGIKTDLKVTGVTAACCAVVFLIFKVGQSHDFSSS
jgi:hypothetical protein